MHLLTAQKRKLDTKVWTS